MNGPVNWPSPKNAAATAMGKANPSRNTKPEVNLRRELHRLGYRFRKHFRVVDGLQRPPEVDLAFTRVRLAVQVHGVFWHGRRPTPKHNSEYWQKKFEYNRRRDEVVADRLKAAGWSLCVVWDDMNLMEQVEAVVRAYDEANTPKGVEQVEEQVPGDGEAGVHLEQTPGLSGRGGGGRRVRADSNDGLQRMAQGVVQ